MYDKAELPLPLSQEPKVQTREIRIPIMGQSYSVVGTTIKQIAEIMDDGGEVYDGCCDVYNHVIYLNRDEADVEILRRVLIHEVVHAFLYELGLVDDWCDERLVNILEVNAIKLGKLITCVGNGIYDF